MASYTRMEVTTTRVEYVLDSPTNWAEVDKAFAACKNELGPDRARWDDVVRVEARDEEVVISYELSKTREAL
jgi:hypothetical protein